MVVIQEIPVYIYIYFESNAQYINMYGVCKNEATLKENQTKKGWHDVS